MLNAHDFFRAKILPLSDEFAAVDYPAFTYMHSLDSETKPLCADEGATHLNQRVPGIAVAFPTQRHGMLHKQFCIGFYEGGDGGEAGEPFAYGTGAIITAETRAKQVLAAAFIGDVITLRGKRYRIEAAPNSNINLIPA